MASTRLVLIMCLMIGHTSGQDERCVASIQGVTGIPGVCPSTWIQWGGKCYKRTERILDWHQAREECVQMGGTMAVPQSESETLFLLNFIPSEDERIWINCNDIQVEGQWVCEEGETEVTFTNMPWGDGEPNNYGGTPEDCAVLSVRVDPSGKWNDEPCGRDYYTVCKQPV